jgi:hypothetical protein
MRSNPQRTAWITLMGGLAIFILLCVGTVVFARWLLFESSTELSVTITVGRNTVSVGHPDESDEIAVRSISTVGRLDRLSTDNNSQGYLAFADPYSGDVVAMVTLHSDSIVTLAQASRPRFSLSENPYFIRLTNVVGRLEVWVRPGLERELRLDIQGPLGTTRISDGGSYQIESTSLLYTTTARSGSATLVNLGGQTQHLTRSKQGRIVLDSPAITVSPGPIDLLPNSMFGQETEWPVAWACAFYESLDNPNAPTGSYNFVNIDGRPTLHIQRLALNSGPGAIGCEQSLGGPDGLDVTGYDSLRLRVSMRVHYQKLSACGVEGSECPIMLYLEYTDLDGNPRQWYHGFYAEYTPNEGRTRCASCLEEHEKINKDAWYIYEGNLLTILPQELRPGSINLIKFYASGHEFDVMLNEVSLVAIQTDPASSVALAR